MLGVVSGRRRQGKSFLTEALTSSTGGLYFPAPEQTEAVTLRSFTAALTRQGVAVSQPLRSWEDAISLLFSATGDHPRAIVIDESRSCSRQAHRCRLSSSESWVQAAQARAARHG
ncbi:MAG: hypothetical protein J2P35_09160 [Actinobacteria bacterium]|nr:hypothetical protein [Actinomycetota bacterium]MBO0815944.1 hypothetical protein [Actinomycetota bacterium]